MIKAVLAFFMLFVLAVPMALPVEEFCADEDCCDSPCSDCYFHQCACSLTFSALPAVAADFSISSSHKNFSLLAEQTITSAGYALLPDLPPRHA